MKYNKSMKRKAVYSAVRQATAMMAIGAASLSATAQQDGVELEEVVVTGSNIPRAISDAPQPITVIDSLDIKLSGINSTADLLRQSAYNSFGSFRERSGSSFGQISTVDLRGLGSQYTAVLINGRRVPGSPFTGSSTVDLNTVPISAIERIEILKDGASAVYGADAIGGVISLVLKDDFEGFEVGGGIERPTREGADSEKYNLLWGKTFNKGHIMAGVEVFDKEAIRDVDREYSRADPTGPNFGNTGGISTFGNTAVLPGNQDPIALGPCDESVYAGVFTNPFGPANGGTGCGFAYADISFQTGNVERKSVFINADYELSDNARLYLDARYNNNETSGRYAPAAAFLQLPATSQFNPTGQDRTVRHRFVGHGNRDDSTDLDETTIVFGVDGELGNGIGYDVWGQYYKYDALQLGNTYIQTSALNAEVAAGNYNVFDPLSQDPVHLAAVARSSAILSRDIKTDYTSAGVTFNGSAFEMGGGEAGWALGVEYADEDYQDIYDALREAGDVGGSAGNSASGDRSRWAAFAEFRMPVTDRLEVNLAARHDDYDGFGTAFSPQVAAKFSPTDNITLRASWGEGFKAPNLIDLNQQLADSNDDLTDLVQCNALGIPASQCPNFQVLSQSGGNPSLEAEESENFNLGTVVDIGNFSASLDYYNVEITNVVTELTLQQINSREAAGTVPPGVVINRGPSVNGAPGSIINILNPRANGAFVETSGIDLGLNWGIETGFGQLDLGVQWVHVFDYEEQASEDSEIESFIGAENGNRAYLENRINTSIRFSTGDLTFALNSQYLDSFRNASDTNDYDSWIGHDITVNWFNAFGQDGLDLTAGVQNLTDEGPSIDEVGGYNSRLVSETYSTAGRIPFINFKYSFGQ